VDAGHERGATASAHAQRRVRSWPLRPRCVPGERAPASARLGAAAAGQPWAGLGVARVLLGRRVRRGWGSGRSARASTAGSWQPHREAAQARLVTSSPLGPSIPTLRSTAVEVALKMAFRKHAVDHGHAAASPQCHVLALANSYHGDTLGAMDCSQESVFNRGQTPWYRARGLFLLPPTCGLEAGMWTVSAGSEQSAGREMRALQTTLPSRSGPPAGGCVPC